jgi:spore maturation protein SpmB
LLAYNASVGPMDRLLEIFHPLLRMRGSTVIVLTIAYAALLSASAAGLTRGIRRLLRPA